MPSVDDILSAKRIAADRSLAVWVGARADGVNFAIGRTSYLRPFKVKAIVLHTSTASLGSMKNFFTNDATTSAHYGISKDGRSVYQFVREANQSFHAGIFDHPTAPLVLRTRWFPRGPLVNPNLWSIGIEHADDGDPEGPRTEGQIEKSAEICFRICQGYGITPSRETIFGHHEIRASKPCPGSLPVAEIVKRVQRKFQMAG